MKRRILYLIATAFVISVIFIRCSKPDQSSGYPVTPVSFENVRIEDTFWSERIKTNREVTIPFALQKISETGRMDNFLKASGKMEGKHEGKRYNDTDVFKVLEGIAYSLQVYPDPELECYADSLIMEIAAAQEEDGYLFTGRTIDPQNPPIGSGAERWSQLNSSHELYNAGHLYEAAVAYFKATGNRELLDVAIKNADFLLEVFGPDKRRDAPGHQEIELALVKLYGVTGKEEYIDLAKFFLDQRGLEHSSPPYPDSSPFSIYNGKEYMQDHKPVTEQDEACGHAVRAVYMYTGMADVAALTGEAAYQNAISSIWNDVVSYKIYLTGGVGARHTTEAFGDKYELPNKEAYTETCASIGNIFWNFRMFLNSGSAQFQDLMEKILYNGMLSGISLSGDRFFYQNPLESDGGYTRSPWFEVSCCPGNIVRFLPSLPGYIYAYQGSDLLINQFISSSTNINAGGNKLEVKMTSGFPWDGKIKLNIGSKKKSPVTVRIRIPGWFKGFAHPTSLYAFTYCTNTPIIVKLNGEDFDYKFENQYLVIEKVWEFDDSLEIDWGMDLKMVRSADSLLENVGKLALQRGPIIYCIEEADNPGVDFDKIQLVPSEPVNYEFDADLLGGIGTLRFTGMQDGEKVYLTAIPYYAWSNRGAGKMKVWIDAM